VAHGVIAALSGSQIKAPGFAGGYLLIIAEQIVFFSFPILFIVTLAISAIAALVSIIRAVFFAWIEISPENRRSYEIISV
jgi:hypothetical protein